MKMLNKSYGALLMSAFLLLVLGLCESTANAASYVVSNINGSGAGSLRAAIGSANADGGDSDITFDATVFVTLKTILLGGTEIGLGNDGKLSITGPTAGVEISGNATSRVFSVATGADVTLTGLSILSGKADFGGGIYNLGILTVRNCLLSGNTGTTEGGAIHNGNNLGNANATLTVTGSLFRGNRSIYGAGLYNQYAATATVTNCTFYNNVADEYGAGVFNGGGSNFTNCTFVVNTNLSAKPAAAVYCFPNYYAGLTNCLGAQNAPDNFGQYITNNGGNIQASTVGEAGLNSTGLASNGGPTQTIALVSRGTAVNAGVNSAVSGFPYDQRGSGYARIVGGGVDSGAFESSFSPVLVNNNGLTVALGGSATITEDLLKATDAATTPLTYTITSGTSHGTVRLNGNPTNSFTQDDIAAGNVSYTQDGSVAGSDSFIFNAGDGKGGYVTGTFAITIPEKRSLVVTTTEDTEANDGLTSLREAINFSNEDGVDSAITFDASVFAAPRKTITLRGEQLPLIVGNGSTSITAPAAGVVLNGNHASNVLETQSDAVVTFKGLTITGGNNDSGGGIRNAATLLVDSCTLTDNSASYGGAIYSENNGTGGSLTIRNSTITSNSAGEGGALYNSVGYTSIESCTITGNSAPAGYGGGIICPGDMFTPVTINVTNSIIAGNSATDVDYEYGNQNSDNIQSGGYNLIGNGTGNGTLFFYENGDVTGVTDPKLGPLAENSGPTQTCALLTGSPAFNAGSTTLTTDQRGTTRPQGPGKDIGAFETVVANVKPTVTISSPTANQSLLRSAFTSITGGASDDVGVTQATLKLYRSRGGANQFWNGSSFVATSTTVAATLASPGIPSTTWSYNVSTALKAALDDGLYSIQVSARDNVGNLGATVSRSFTLVSDTVKPTIVLTTPTVNQVLPITGFASITGSATDNMAVAQVSVKLYRSRGGVNQFWNGSSFITTSTTVTATLATPGSPSTNWSYGVSAALKAALDEGTYSLQVTSRDAAGNSSSAVSRSFTLYADSVAPAVVLSTPTINQNLTIAAFNSITGSASDNKSVALVTVKLYRSRNGANQFWNGSSFVGTSTTVTATLATPGSTSTPWSFTVSPELKAALDAGSYSLQVVSRDAAGIASPVVSRSFSLTTGSGAITSSASAGNS